MNSQRLHYMDFLRATLMSLGVVYHSAKIFSVDDPWRISNPDTSPFFDGLIWCFHAFRMPAFFIVSGYFTYLIYRKYAETRFVVDRLIKLGVPLVVVGLTANIWMAGMSDGLFDSAAPYEHRDYWLSGAWQAHLWFLANLLLYCLGVKVLGKYIPVVFKIKLPVTAIYLLVPLCFFILIRVDSKIDDHLGAYAFFMDTGNFFRYGVYFAFGVYLYCHRTFFEELLSNTTLAFGSLVLWLMTLALIEQDTVKELVTYCVGFSMAVCIFILSKRFFSKPSPMILRLSSSSYTIYLAHQPFIVWAGAIIVSLNLPYYFKFLLLVISTYIVCYAFHHYLVRPFALSRFLFNGQINYNGSSRAKSPAN